MGIDTLRLRLCRNGGSSLMYVFSVASIAHTKLNLLTCPCLRQSRTVINTLLHNKVRVSGVFKGKLMPSSLMCTIVRINLTPFYWLSLQPSGYQKLPSALKSIQNVRLNGPQFLYRKYLPLLYLSNTHNFIIALDL